jgi:hypothetical protein
MIRIRFNPDHEAYSLWDTERSCYVNKWGDPDSDYHCVSRDVAVMRRRDLNEYRRTDTASAPETLPNGWGGCYLASDIPTLEAAAESLTRAGEIQHAVKLWAIALRIREAVRGV